jgi:Na+/H+ antiporter NhaD/arsenite permease-like protein
MTYPTPAWAVAPFIVYLLLIATLPLLWGAFWEPNRNKLIVAGLASVPVLIYLPGIRAAGGQLLLHTVCDYVSFITLLAALFTISGGICLRGSLAGSSAANTMFLAVGWVLGSLIGTTGASVLLIRPLLRANERRGYTTHIVVFFIFIVSNAAGLLTPLGDPPLFLGFLRGVPFTWTFRLVAPWALVNGVLLSLFTIIDRVIVAREKRSPRAATVSPLPTAPFVPLRLDGAINLLWMLGVMVVVFVMGTYGRSLFGEWYLRSLVQTLGMLACAVLSLVSTKREVHQENRFSWAPIVEVAVIFLGVFVTMIPALTFLAERGGSLGITQPWQFFWASGALSSLLDNAPTYLTFASLAVGVTNSGGAALSLEDLGGLARHPVGQHLLAAVSCGAVFMGAITYLGNGPNFIVKSIAEQQRVRMPSFFGYLLWSFGILLPLFGLVSYLFF